MKNYFGRELKKRSNIPGAINMNAALEYAERSLNAVESMYDDRRNKPVVIVFADNPRNFNSPVPFSRVNSRIDYFLVTTRSDGGLDRVASAEENKVQLDWWSNLATQFDLSKPVKIINRDQDWKCMDPNAAPTTPTTTVTTTLKMTTSSTTATTTSYNRECPPWMEQWDASRLVKVTLSTESDYDDNNIFLAACLQERIDRLRNRRTRQLVDPEIKLTFRFESSRDQKVESGELFKSSSGIIWSYKATDPENSETAFELKIWLSENSVSYDHILQAEKIMQSPEFCSVVRPDNSLALDGASFNTAEFHLVDYTLVLQTPLSDSNELKLRNFFTNIHAVARFPNEIILREVLSHSGEKLANLRTILERDGCTLERCSNGSETNGKRH
ncbi:unnamed protein product [Oikopleura dioica]|uniref:Uncharacterized protein n=1 Tax=Oikopleura dioica TaxID=34765 RepID=E4XG85_OIKDI|nr:unnamed protein product [Oikopleura dioica]